MDIGQIKHVVHHLRILEGFGFDPIDSQEIHFFGGQQQQRDACGRETKQTTRDFRVGHNLPICHGVNRPPESYQVTIQ